MFLGWLFFPLSLKDLKGPNVSLQGVLHSQELCTYLILFKTQTETLQELLSKMTQN